MGNHEFNAIAYYIADHEGEGCLRPYSEKNTGQHQAFLDAYQGSPAAYEDTINWLKTLLLWLDLGDLRVIHAGWDKDVPSELRGNLRPFQVGQWVVASRHGPSPLIGQLRGSAILWPAAIRLTQAIRRRG